MSHNSHDITHPERNNYQHVQSINITQLSKAIYTRTLNVTGYTQKQLLYYRFHNYVNRLKVEKLEAMANFTHTISQMPKKN